MHCSTLLSSYHWCQVGHCCQNLTLLDENRNASRAPGLVYEGLEPKFAEESKTCDVDPSKYGQYVLVESTILGELWGRSECPNPACDHVKLDPRSMGKVGACVVASFCCSRCNVLYTVRSDFNAGGECAGPNVNQLYSMLPVVCGQSPTQVANGMRFLDVVLPDPSATSEIQARHLRRVDAHRKSCPFVRPALGNLTNN
jgi:hypothetical protein